MSNSPSKGTALVTGASRGIGAGYAAHSRRSQRGTPQSARCEPRASERTPHHCDRGGPQHGASAVPSPRPATGTRREGSNARVLPNVSTASVRIRHVRAGNTTLARVSYVRGGAL